MANIDTAIKDELHNHVRNLARDLCEANDLDASDLSFLETALERWDTSARFDEQELAASLFRALTEAGIEEWVAEELADLFALDFDPDLAEEEKPAQNEELVERVRELGRELRAEHGTDWYADANKIEEALRNWDRSERFDEQELAWSLFRALTEARIDKQIAETLTNDFAFHIDPRFAR